MSPEYSLQNQQQNPKRSIFPRSPAVYTRNKYRCVLKWDESYVRTFIHIYICIWECRRAQAKPAVVLWPASSRGNADRGHFSLPPSLSLMAWTSSSTFPILSYIYTHISIYIYIYKPFCTSLSPLLPRALGGWQARRWSIREDRIRCCWPTHPPFPSNIYIYIYCFSPLFAAASKSALFPRLAKPPLWTTISPSVRSLFRKSRISLLFHTCILCFLCVCIGCILPRLLDHSISSGLNRLICHPRVIFFTKKYRTKFFTRQLFSRLFFSHFSFFVWPWAYHYYYIFKNFFFFFNNIWGKKINQKICSNFSLGKFGELFFPDLY